MSGFSIRNPYFIIVICLALVVIGITSLARMPVDLFPTINLPEVVVATFYSGMPPQDIETDITDPLERFFTSSQRHRSHGIALAAGREHHPRLFSARNQRGCRCYRTFESRLGGSETPSARHAAPRRFEIRRIQSSRLPGDAEGENLNQTQLHDIGQFAIRNQIAVVKGAEIPPPFGGKYRQVMVYVDPYKLVVSSTKSHGCCERGE